MDKKTLSILVLILSIILAVILYIVIFTNVSNPFQDFNGIVYLCLVTFMLALGIFISAILVEKKN